MENFVAIAKQYISWVEGGNTRSIKDIEYVHDLLLSLYAAAFTLEYSPDASELEEERTHHREQWKAHSLKVRQISQEIPQLYKKLLETIKEK